MSLALDLQQLIAARLSADDYFHGPPPITVLTEKAGDLVNKIEAALQKIGIGVLLVTPRMERAEGGPAYGVTVMAVITENLMVNQARSGTQKSALDVADHIAALVDEWAPSDIWAPVRVEGLTLTEGEPTVVYQMPLQTHVLVLAES